MKHNTAAGHTATHKVHNIFSSGNGSRHPTTTNSSSSATGCCRKRSGAESKLYAPWDAPHPAAHWRSSPPLKRRGPNQGTPLNWGSPTNPVCDRLRLRRPQLLSVLTRVLCLPPPLLLLPLALDVAATEQCVHETPEW